MAKKKRVSRKELLKEPDEFLTLSAKALRWGAENRKRLSYALMGLAGVVVAAALIGYFLTLSERRAYRVFEEGLSHYVAQVSGEDSADLQEKAKERFAKVLDDHGSTRAAKLSLPLHGDMHYKAGAYDKAIEVYEEALPAFPGNPGMQKLIWNNLGYAYEGKGDYKTAAQYFQKITESEGGLLRGDAYFNLGRMYEAVNKPQEARQAYEHLAEHFQDSVHFRMGKEKAMRLKVQG